MTNRGWKNILVNICLVWLLVNLTMLVEQWQQCRIYFRADTFSLCVCWFCLLIMMKLYLSPLKKRLHLYRDWSSRGRVLSQGGRCVQRTFMDNKRFTSMETSHWPSNIISTSLRYTPLSPLTIMCLTLHEDVNWALFVPGCVHVFRGTGQSGDMGCGWLLGLQSNLEPWGPAVSPLR